MKPDSTITAGDLVEQKVKTFTEDDVQLSYTVMALLNVCALAMDEIEDVSTAEHTQRYAGSVSAVIRHTLSVADNLHGKLEALGRLEVTA